MGKQKVRRFRIMSCLCVSLFFCAASRLCAATASDPIEQSIEQLSGGLQSLADSSTHLANTNEDLIERNQILKKNVELLQRRLRAVQENNAALGNESASYEEKNKARQSDVKQNEDPSKELKDRITQMDQDIAIKKIALDERKKQQRYLLDWLKIANKGGGIDQDTKEIKDMQTKLLQKARAGRTQLKKTEDEWKELNFWYGEPSVSMPKLNKRRDELKKRLSNLKTLGISEQWSNSQNQIQALEVEVRTLVKQHDTYEIVLKDIENKYVTNDSSESKTNDQKLRLNLAKLKKENKILQKEVANLRLEMVNLDKKKSDLDKQSQYNK